MARMLVTLDGRSAAGGTPLVMHCERLSDALHPFALELAKFSGKSKKTEADHLEMALVEFMGAMYHDGTDDWLQKRPNAPKASFLSSVIGAKLDQPYIPGGNIVASITKAAKQHRLGAAVERGVSPATYKCPVVYEGPTKTTALWEDGRFAFRKGVGIGGKRVMRTRPIFEEWQMECVLEVDLTQINPEQIEQLARAAGRYQGIGDNRKGGYGRFAGTAVVLADEKRKAA